MTSGGVYLTLLRLPTGTVAVKLDIDTMLHFLSRNSGA